MRDLLDEIPVKKVRIGLFTFAFEKMTSEESNAKKAWGLCKNVDQVIRLSPGMSHERFLQVLIHEITHAINHIWGLTDDNDEEEFTNMGSTGLVTVWRDNPKLFTWLNKQFKKLNDAD